MSNPRLLTLSSYRSKRTQQSTLVNFIDKLPHIMKEDKMLLRKKIKEGDQGILNILKKVNLQMYREDDDYKRLEATVRKYLNELKVLVKEEQINRYKNALKSYRSSCEVHSYIKQKPSNKENFGTVGKGIVTFQMKRMERATGPRSVKSPISSLEKLHELKHFKNSKPFYQPLKLDSLKAKYSIEKEKHKNFTTIELNPRSKLRSSKLLSSSSSTKNLTKKEISYLDMNPIKTETSDSGVGKCHTDRYFPTQQAPTQYKVNDQKGSKVSVAQFHNLFTSPDLLLECKIILQQAKQAPTFDILPPSTPVSPRFHSVTNQSTDYLLQKSKQPVHHPILPGVSFSKESNDSNLLQAQAFKKQPEEKQQQKIELNGKSAEYIFDHIFSDNYQIRFENFSQIINKLFVSPVELYRIFQKADPSRDGIVTIYDFGKCLQQILGNEQNYIKDIFQLLDMDRKGYITESDITNFVHQIVDTSCESEENVKQMFMKVLFQADFKNNGKIEYWGLYFIKSLQCFKDMVVYISQFEFEVQC